jgi:hypothetical protein
VVAGIAFYASSPLSDEQVDQALHRQSADLFRSDGQPRFKISNVVEAQPGWYVLTIALTDVQTEPNTVILRQGEVPDGPLTVYAGPGTDFPPETIHLPDAVRRAVQDR